jgi:electron transfer flavoprotein alpha subunit
MSILVYTENWEGKFKKQSYELVSYATKLAGMNGSSVVALSIGKVSDDELRKLGRYGAEKIVVVDNPGVGVFDTQVYTQVIAGVASAEQSTVVVLGQNISGKALAPRLAVRMKAGLASSVIALPTSLNPLTVKKKVFSGKAFSNQVIKTDAAILTLATNSFEVIENPKNAELVTNSSFGDLVATTKVHSVSKQTGQILLTDAEIVVSGGRGMKSGDNWGPIEELAELLGAATACSRPVSDEGWRPHNEHTGQTGKIIAPNLYFAFGISGAIQHLAGVSSSKCIVAVNTDPDAPIFEAADYGIIGDAQKVLPELIEAIRQARS